MMLKVIQGHQKWC